MKAKRASRQRGEIFRSLGQEPARSCRGYLVESDKPEEKPRIKFETSMSDLDLMIKNGWGDTPQSKIPEDWRTRKKMGRLIGWIRYP